MCSTQRSATFISLKVVLGGLTYLVHVTLRDESVQLISEREVVTERGEPCLRLQYGQLLDDSFFFSMSSSRARLRLLAFP